MPYLQNAYGVNNLPPGLAEATGSISNRAQETRQEEKARKTQDEQFKRQVGEARLKKLWAAAKKSAGTGNAAGLHWTLQQATTEYRRLYTGPDGRIVASAPPFTEFYANPGKYYGPGARVEHLNQAQLSTAYKRYLDMGGSWPMDQFAQNPNGAYAAIDQAPPASTSWLGNAINTVEGWFGGGHPTPQPTPQAGAASQVPTWPQGKPELALPKQMALEQLKPKKANDMLDKGTAAKILKLFNGDQAAAEDWSRRAGWNIDVAKPTVSPEKALPGTAQMVLDQQRPQYPNQPLDTDTWMYLLKLFNGDQVAAEEWAQRAGWKTR